MLLLNLPAELVLPIVELAAWDEVDSHRDWVASLCLVCDTFRRAATQPLYHTVVIDYKNIDEAVWTASLKDTPFLRTRRLTIWGHQENVARVTNEDFAHAFANVEYLAASIEVLRALAAIGRLLRCAVVFVTDEVCNDEECDALRPLLQSCTHLHIVLHLGDVDSEDWQLPDLQRLLGPRTTRLLVDPMAANALLMEHATQMVEMLLSLPCEQVLLRMVEIEEEMIQDLCALAGNIARDRRDTRLWINDSPREPERNVFQHDCSDMQRGRALWDVGRPLYVPEGS